MKRKDTGTTLNRLRGFLPVCQGQEEECCSHPLCEPGPRVCVQPVHGEEMNKLSESEKGYIAGFLDGEGEI